MEDELNDIQCKDCFYWENEKCTHPENPYPEAHTPKDHCCGFGIEK